MRPLRYLTFALFAFNILFVIDAFQQAVQPVTLTQTAIEPVICLFNSKLYLQEEDYERSQQELSTAIRKIYLLRDRLNHKAGQELVDEVLPSLVKLRDAYLTSVPSTEVVNDAYVRALLAMAYLQVEHALACVGEDNRADELNKSLRKAMYITKKALILSEGTKKDYEIDIYASMYEVLKSKHLSANYQQKTLTGILHEIRDLEVTFDHVPMQYSLATQDGYDGKSH